MLHTGHLLIAATFVWKSKRQFKSKKYFKKAQKATIRLFPNRGQFNSNNILNFQQATITITQERATLQRTIKTNLKVQAFTLNNN